jgi:hypothetical protein
MQPTCGLLALILFLLAGAIAYEHAVHTAPSPYAVCDGKPTEKERQQCRHLVDFALSAGW